MENAYEECLCHELAAAKLEFARQVPVPLNYKGTKLDCGFRLDVLVAGELVLEIKAVEKLLPIHEAQLLTYLKLTGCRVGLLMNFNSLLFKDGVRRLVK